MPANRARRERAERGGAALLRITRLQERAQAPGTDAVHQPPVVRTDTPGTFSGMTRLVLVVVLVFAVVAAPASAATRVSWSTRAGQIPPFWADYMRIIGIGSDDGVNHQIVVKPSG